MNPTAIYSKSGKGVQEAAGKTSLLARPDRAVLSAIDGRATLQDVAQKVGKAFDSAFQAVISKLDKDGFIREVSAGTAVSAPAAKPAGKAAAKAAPKVPDDPASDLDFSMLGSSSKPPSAPSRPAAPPAKPAAPPPKPAAPPPPPPKEQESALFKARQEAEAKAVAERERQRKEAEEKLRAETEARLRAEAEAKARVEADARLAAAAEAKAKAEAEAKRAREEAERARKEAEERERRAREEAERARKEAEERERKAREEAERLRREAEERERKAREEAERKAREEAERRKAEEARIRREAEEKARREAEERMRREQEELRRKLEEERKAREEAERKAREEAERVRREAEAEAERARKELEEERRRLEEERRSRDEDKRSREDEERREEEERAARRRAREEEEAREAAEREARRKAREEDEAREEAARAAKKAKKAAPPPPEKTGDEFADSLMADLDSFNTREEEETKEKAEAERKAREAAERRAREEAERRAKEEAEQRAKEEKRRAKEEKERKKREEEERLRREEEEEKARIREEEERRRKEAEERAAKAKEEEALARRASSTQVGAGGYVSEDARRKRQLDVGPRDPSLVKRKQRSWGKPVAITLFVLLLVALGAAHLMPVSTIDYERAASEAIGRPVRIGSARLWLFTGLQVRMTNVSVGDVKIARVVAHPSLGSLTEPRKEFSLIELEEISLPQEAAGKVLFSRAKADNFTVVRVAARKLQLPGALALPKDLDAEATLDANGAPRLVTVRGGDGLVARLEVRGENVEFSVDAGTFTVPFAPEVTFTTFGMKGTANESGLTIKQWDGQALNGTLSGTARVRWGGTWRVDGVITARGINAAVFAPALLSEGRGEGTGKFQMSGVEPAKLGAGALIEGNFTISKGVLGSFDLSRAIQTGGKAAQGRTQFSEMNGQVSYDRGEVELRNVTIGAGALNAGASAVISPKGALSGRIVADVRTASQTLRATLLLGGTVKEPQVRN